MVRAMSDLQIALFDLNGSDTLPGVPALLGGHCAACGYKFFPMQHYGCERCGETQALQERRLSGRGTLATFAKVHVHADPNLPPPFTVGSVKLEDDVVVRAFLDPAYAESASIGDLLVAKLAKQQRPGRGDFDLQFTRVDGAER